MRPPKGTVERRVLDVLELDVARCLGASRALTRLAGSRGAGMPVMTMEPDTAPRVASADPSRALDRLPVDEGDEQPLRVADGR